MEKASYRAGQGFTEVLLSRLRLKLNRSDRTVHTERMRLNQVTF